MEAPDGLINNSDLLIQVLTWAIIVEASVVGVLFFGGVKALKWMLDRCDQRSDDAWTKVSDLTVTPIRGLLSFFGKAVFPSPRRSSFRAVRSLHQLLRLFAGYGVAVPNLRFGRTLSGVKQTKSTYP